MTQAQLAQGMTIEFDGSGIAEVTNFDLGYSVDELDVTNHDSVGGVREFIAALISPQEITFTVNWISTEHQSLFDAIGDSSSPGSLTIELADASLTFTVEAWVKGCVVHGDATGAALTADITFRTTGPVSTGS